MSNYGIKLDLLKLQGAFLTNLQGKTATKRCLVIPIEGSDLYLGEKGLYVDLTALELKERKYSDTHFLKINVSRERYDAMSEDERKAIPILGGMHPLEKRQQQVSSTITVTNNDDIPF